MLFRNLAEDRLRVRKKKKKWRRAHRWHETERRPFDMWAENGSGVLARGLRIVWGDLFHLPRETDDAKGLRL